MSSFQIDEKTLRRIKLPLLVSDETWLSELDNFENEIISGLIEECREQINLEEEKSKEHKIYLIEKKKLMELILEFSDEVNTGNDENAEKKLEQARKRVLELNTLIDDVEFEIEIAAKEVSRINKLLFHETIESVYTTITMGKEKLLELDEEILKIRKILGDMYQEKFGIENKVEKVYKYLHKTLGKDETNRLDDILINLKDGSDQ